jgi:Zn-dependent protease with chaperone function
MLARMCRARLAAVLIGALTVSGCMSSSAGTGDGQSAFSGMFGQVPDQGAGPQFDHLQPREAERALGFAAAPSNASVENADARSIALRAPSMERYLQRVAQRLLRHWHGEQPERIGLFLMAEDAFSTYALSSGDVLLSVRAVETVETEDELAALLAHEMGHVLLGHHENERAVRTLSEVGAIAATAAATIAVADRMESERTANGRRIFLPNSQQAGAQAEVATAVGAFQGGLELVTAIGLSAYNRSQEKEADRFAVEMLHHAGYDPMAMARVLERIRTSQQEQDARRQAYQLQARSLGDAVFEIATLTLGDIAAALHSTHPDTGERIGLVGRHYAAIIGDTGELVEPSVGGLSAARNASDFRALASFYTRLNRLIAQEPSETREQQLRSLLNSGYGRSAVARTMAYPAISSSDPDEAYSLLAAANNTANAPLSFYALLAKGHASRGNGRGARSAINEMAQTYGWDVAYPSGIRVANILDDDEWAADLLERCLADSPSTVQAECSNANRGLRADEEFQTMNTILGGLARSAGGLFR